MKINKKTFIYIALLVIAFTIGRYTVPSKSIKESNTSNIEKHIDTETTITENKDGTKVTQIKQIDRSKESSTSYKASESKNLPEWTLDGYYDLKSAQYGVGASKRIIGSLYIGAYTVGFNSIGVSMHLGF